MTETEAQSEMIDAISTSVRETRTVALGYDASGRVEDAFLGNPDTDEDEVEGVYHDFWGSTDGREWRVRVLLDDVD